MAGRSFSASRLGIYVVHVLWQSRKSLMKRAHTGPDAYTPLRLSLCSVETFLRVRASG